MSFADWLRNLRSFCHLGTTTRKSRRAARSAPAKRVRLQLETLEDRVVPSFSPAVMYPAGTSPQAVVTADFNGDGRLDLAAANSSSGIVSILVGNGDGTFQAARNNTVGGYPKSLAVGDFNGDGKLDLVVPLATNTSGQASVLLGNGDGTFQAPRIIAAGGSEVVGVAVADFNADGKMDLAVAGQNSGYFGGRSDVTLLLGHGDGTFDASYNHLGDNAGSIAAGDFNGDGKRDLVWTAQATGAVGVQMGNGDGTFQAAQSFATDFYPDSVAVADLNGDGKPDLATANETGSVSSVSVLLGNGDGTFQAASNYASVNHPTSVAVADFNGDGKPDVVTAGWGVTAGAGNSTVSVLLGNGDGSLRAAQYSASGSDSEWLAVGDFNGDGRPDVAVADHNAGVAVLLNAGDWSSTPAQASSLIVSGFPSSTTAGVAGNLTVTLKDPYGNIASGYTGTVHFSSSDGLAALPANYTFTAADKGVHTFTVTLKTAGSQSITVTDTATGGLSGSETSITVNPAAASQFILSSPSTVTSGVAFSLTITVKDAYGNVVIGYTGTIHFTSTDRTATLPANYTFTAADQGVHTFTGMVLRKKGTHKITLTDTLNSSLTGSVTENVL